MNRLAFGLVLIALIAICHAKSAKTAIKDRKIDINLAYKLLLLDQQRNSNILVQKLSGTGTDWKAEDTCELKCPTGSNQSLML